MDEDPEERSENHCLFDPFRVVFGCTHRHQRSDRARRVTLGAGDDTAYWDFQHRKARFFAETG